jgi:hypothetical protein
MEYINQSTFFDFTPFLISPKGEMVVPNSFPRGGKLGRGS